MFRVAASPRLASPHLFEGGAVALHVAPVHLQHLLRPAAHPGAERLDGRAVHAPLGHAELPQVGPGVARQGLTVLEEEAAQLAAGIWKTGVNWRGFPFHATSATEEVDSPWCTCLSGEGFLLKEKSCGRGEKAFS